MTGIKSHSNEAFKHVMENPVKKSLNFDYNVETILHKTYMLIVALLCWKRFFTVLVDAPVRDI